MSQRPAAFIVDNFLSADKWQYITDHVNQSNFLSTDSFNEWRDSFYEEIIGWIDERTQEMGIWQDHWKQTIPLYSFINTCPVGFDREVANDGYHMDYGSYVYYIHPQWGDNWGGRLKLRDCEVDTLQPTPNRFVWINPGIWHGIEVTNSNATNNRITVVGWPEGCVENATCDRIINTNTGN